LGSAYQRESKNGVFMDWSTWIVTNRRRDGYQLLTEL
jgi:hypothetical protein